MHIVEILAMVYLIFLVVSAVSSPELKMCVLNYQIYQKYKIVKQLVIRLTISTTNERSEFQPMFNKLFRSQPATYLSAFVPCTILPPARAGPGYLFSWLC